MKYINVGDEEFEFIKNAKTLKIKYNDFLKVYKKNIERNENLLVLCINKSMIVEIKSIDLMDYKGEGFVKIKELTDFSDLLFLKLDKYNQVWLKVEIISMEGEIND